MRSLFTFITAALVGGGNPPQAQGNQPVTDMYRIGGGALMSHLDPRGSVGIEGDLPTMAAGVDYGMTTSDTSDSFIVRVPIVLDTGTTMENLVVWGNQLDPYPGQMDCWLKRTDNYGWGEVLADVMAPGIVGPYEQWAPVDPAAMVVDNYSYSYDVQCFVSNNGGQLMSSTLLAIGIEYTR